MRHVFPEETVNLVRSRVEKVQEERKLSDFATLELFCSGLAEEHVYGFEHNLRTGLYAHYYHEMRKFGIPHYNCTTVIPTLYIKAECLGFRPQIVQFQGFQEDSQEAEQASHFALICYDGKGDQILVDPFWKSFGYFTETNKGLKIKGSKKFSSKIRRFERMDYIPAIEFAQMMERLRDPAGSLDMLVPGQLAYKRESRVMVYYDPDSNTLSTRIHILQTGIQDKVIFCHQHLDESGETNKVEFELFQARGSLWNSLIKPQIVARLGLIEAEDLLAHYHHSTIPLEFADRLLANLSEKEKQSLQRRMVVRTLYEEMKAEREAPEIDCLPPKPAKGENELERIISGISENSNFIFIDEDSYKDGIPDIKNNSDSDHVGMSPEAREKVDFARSLKEEDFLEIKDIDLRIGYIAMVEDFARYLDRTYNDFLLLSFMGPIRDKVRARFESRRKSHLAA